MQLLCNRMSVHASLGRCCWKISLGALVTAVTALLPTVAPASGAEPTGQANHLFGEARTGYTDQALPPPYRLAWTHRAMHRPRRAWREPAWEIQRIDFDYAYPFSAGNGLVYVASSSDHAVHALDLATGEERWRFFTDGPVRLAPHVDGDRLWFSSDDGWTYCLDAREGHLVWKYRPHIPDERLVGNEQMISRWPARSGVLVADGKAYTTFGMWSPEGIVVACLNARTGAVLWENDGAGTYYMTQPHFEAMGGVSPQGYLALNGNVLVVPCGRATPAFFDAATGEFLYHESEGLFPGGAWTMQHGNLTFTPCPFLRKPNPVRPEASEAEIDREACLLALDSHTHEEVFHLFGALQGVVTPDGILNLIGRRQLSSVALRDVLAAAPKSYNPKRANSEGHFVEAEPLQRWATPVDRVYELIQAGGTLIAGGRGTLTAYDAEDGSKVWEATLQGDVRELLVVGSALLVGTTEGEVHCYRRDGEATARVVASRPAAIPIPESRRREAASLLQAAGVSDGYGLVLGEADTAFLAALANGSKFLWHWAAGNRDVAETRRQLADAGLYGVRIAIHNHKSGTLPYTDLLANVILFRVNAERDLENVAPAELYRVLRPCGGVAVVACPDALKPAVKRWLRASGATEAECGEFASGYRIVRGPLPGAGVWTHQYADAGRTGASDDRRVRLPLKVLWFGSLGPADIVSRHYRGPCPLAVNGRMFVAGIDYVHAVDAYNGRILWERNLPDVGRWPAAFRGGSVAVDSEAVYTLQGDTCLRLDQSTGETLQTFDVPREAPEPPPPATNPIIAKRLKTPNDPVWEYLAVAGDVVIGSYGRPNVCQQWRSEAFPENSLVFALDKRTGKTVWTYEPTNTIDSAAIAIDGDRLFLIDGRAAFEIHSRRKGRPDKADIRPEDFQSRLLLRSESPARPRVLKALDLATGRELWHSAELGAAQRSLHATKGVVLASLSRSDDTLRYDGPGLSAFAGEDGRLLWSKDSAAVDPVIVGETVFFTAPGRAKGEGTVCELHTGEAVTITDPISGEAQPFAPVIRGGCARPAGCPSLLMRRSGSLGFFDLRQRSGIYHYPNMRASCWMNMIPAEGLVLVPDGSSSCPCAYNYKTTIALMPAVRHNHWGLFSLGRTGRGKEERVRSLRVNFGAPGDKPSAQGDIWYAFPRPSTTGPRGAGGMGSEHRDTPPISLVAPTAPVPRVMCNPDWTPIDGAEHPWIYTCGLRGPMRLKLVLGAPGTAPSPYRVVLHFCELQGKHPASGTFTVKLQDKAVFTDINVLRDAGGPNRALARETTLKLGDTLTVEIAPETGPPPLLTGLQVVAL